MRLAAANPSAATITTTLTVIQNGDENSLNSAATPGMSPPMTPGMDGNHRLCSGLVFISSFMVLGDRVRTALGEQAEDLESVELLALTSFGELPVPAQERLRIREGQANALIRLMLRPLARTMTDPQANQIRDDVYLALHEGPVKELIAE